MRGHIRKRGAKWVVVVDVGRDESGQRRQRWQGGYETRRAAQEALTALLGRVQAGTYVEPSKQTVAVFLRRWLQAAQGRLRPSTWTSYRMNLELYVIPALGDIPLQSLSPTAINSLYGDLLRSGRRRRPGGLSARSVRYTATILKRALSDAVRWGSLARNPAALADPPSASAARVPEMKVWNAGEVRTFLEYTRTDRLSALWLLVSTTGLRRGEVLGLRWSDVDLAAGRLSVRQTLLCVRGRLSFSTPKTSRSRRTLALDNGTVEVLRAHRRRQVDERLAWGPAYQDNDLVFCREDGHPLNPDQVSRAFRQHVKAAALPPLHFHCLRHSYASLGLALNVPAKLMSERLGHASIGITLDTYSHVLPPQEQEAADRIAAAVFNT